MNGAPSGGEVVWLNGNLLSTERACISPLDRGFLYGDGLFETIRAERGRPLYLEMHLERLAASLSALRITLSAFPDWQQVLKEVLRANDLMQEVAYVKIIVTRGAAPPLGLPVSSRPTLCVIARRYGPISSGAYLRGWNLHVFAEGFSPPLARFKTLNYLFHLAARQAAVDANCDEAVVLDREGCVSETSAGSLLARTGERWWTPESAEQLPGITINCVSAILLRLGITVERRATGLKDLLAADMVWVLNSLIGIMPVAQIDGNRIADRASDMAAQLRALLFKQG